ncbi:hypothetical protein D3C76_1069320 [compost metagenome]
MLIEKPIRHSAAEHAVQIIGTDEILGIEAGRLVLRAPERHVVFADRKSRVGVVLVIIEVVDHQAHVFEKTLLPRFRPVDGIDLGGQLDLLIMGEAEVEGAVDVRVGVRAVAIATLGHVGMHVVILKGRIVIHADIGVLPVIGQRRLDTAHRSQQQHSQAIVAHGGPPFT